MLATALSVTLVPACDVIPSGPGSLGSPSARLATTVARSNGACTNALTLREIDVQIQIRQWHPDVLHPWAAG